MRGGVCIKLHTRRLIFASAPGERRLPASAGRDPTVRQFKKNRYPSHLALAAFCAISFRLRADIPAARALPPMRPSAAAAAFLPSSVVTSSILPVAIVAIMTARTFTSGGTLAFRSLGHYHRVMLSGKLARTAEHAP